VLLVERVRYYVANDADGVPAFLADRGRAPRELLFRGIEDLQFSYDIGTAARGSRFASGGANAVTPPGCTDTKRQMGGGLRPGTFGSCTGVAAGRTSHHAPQLAAGCVRSRHPHTAIRQTSATVNIVWCPATRASPDGSGDDCRPC